MRKMDARARGNRLSRPGQRLQNAPIALLPEQFSNIHVIFAGKPT